MKNPNLIFMTYMLLTQVIVCISIILDVFIVRQILGFLFYTIIPGFLLLKILGIKRGNVAETVVYSVGLSIAFLMLIGLLMNELGSLGLLLQPLSLEPTAIGINVAIFFMIILNYLKNRDWEPLDIKGVRFWPLLSFFILPIVSVIGVLLVRYYNNNILSISVVIAIAIIIVTSVISSRISSKLSLYYPLIIVSVVISLLLSHALTSNYLYGSDIQGEFNTFTKTLETSWWNFQNNSYFQQASDNSMLSITIFPTILSNLLNINPGWVFKILFPIFFSLLPLGLYLLYRQYWSERAAFVSAIFFVANYAFFTTILSDAKQLIGELFFIILFLILFSKNIDDNSSKWIFFMFAFFGLMVSHYSMTFMFLLFILFAWLGGKLFRKRPFTKIPDYFIAFSFSLSFLWYVYVVQASFGAGGPFGKFVGVIETTLRSFLSEFLSSASRGAEVQAAMGLLSRPSTLHYIGTILYDLTILLILIGYISLISKWRKGKFDSAFFSIMSATLALLISAVILPRFAGYLELGRLYHILLIFLAPLFISGAEALFMTISRLKPRKKTVNLNVKQKKRSYCFLLSLIILTSFFLFQTGVIYEITDDPAPSSIALSGGKMKDSIELIHERDVFSATWLSRYGEIESMWTFSDRASLDHVLNGYSSIDRRMLSLLSNNTELIIPGDTYILQEKSFFPDLNITYVYLSQFNVLQEIITWDFGNNLHFNINQIPMINKSDAFVNKIYSNGASEIDYRVP